MPYIPGTYHHSHRTPANARVLPAPAGRTLSHRLVAEALLLTLLTVLLAAGLLAQKRTIEEGVESSSVSYGINASMEPLQKQTAFYSTVMKSDSGTATLTSDTLYSISARVESVRGYDDDISSIAPYDLLLAWGQVAENSDGNSLAWEQSDRQGTVSGSLKTRGETEIDTAYVISHISNNHVIPANSNIMAGMASIQPGDLVRIDGRLVDLKLTKGSRLLEIDTSRTRYDQGDGACEVILVEHLRVNGRSY